MCGDDFRFFFFAASFRLVAQGVRLSVARHHSAMLMTDRDSFSPAVLRHGVPVPTRGMVTVLLLTRFSLRERTDASSPLQFTVNDLTLAPVHRAEIGGLPVTRRQTQTPMEVQTRAKTKTSKTSRATAA